MSYSLARGFSEGETVGGGKLRVRTNVEGASHSLSINRLRRGLQIEEGGRERMIGNMKCEAYKKRIEEGGREGGREGG